MKKNKGVIDPGSLFAILAISVAWGAATIGLVDHKKAAGESVKIERNPLYGMDGVVTRYDGNKFQVYKWGRGLVAEGKNRLQTERKAAELLKAQEAQ